MTNPFPEGRDSRAVDRARVQSLRRKLKAGGLTVGAAMARLRTLPFEDLGYANVDTHRALRRGYPEAVYCEGKTDAQVTGIVERLSKHHRTVLATRVRPGTAKAVRARLRRQPVSEFPEARLLA